jgi:hypothetical protein
MDLGGLIRGAIGGAQDAAAEVLIRYRADTSELDKATQALEAQAAKETQVQEAKTAKLKQLQEQEIALQERYSQVSKDLFTARAFGMQAEIVKLNEHKIAVEQQIQTSQLNQQNIQREITLLSEHRAMLISDAAAMRERAAGGIGGGISSAGSTAIGVLGGMLALNAVTALTHAVETAVKSYAEYGHAIEHVSQLMGTSAENASVLVYAFNQFGLSVADAERTIAQLTRHIVDNEQQFNALGIATRNTNGEFKNQYDIFNGLREVMSNAADGTAKTALQLQLASRGGSAAGQSFAELNQVLSLTDEQWAALRRQAELHNAVLSETEALTGTQMVLAGRTMEQSLAGIGRAFSHLTSGPLMGFLSGLNDVLDTLSAFGKETANLNFFEKIGAAFDFSGSGNDIFARVRADVEKAKADRATIADLQSQGDGDVSGGLKNTGAGARQAETQAIRDEIDALREAATAREDEMRTALTAYERVRQAAIKSIQDAQVVRDDAHNAEIKALQDEQKAADDRFKDENEARQQQIANLRTEIQLREQALQQEEAAYTLAEDQKNVAHDKLDTTTVQGPHENIEAYYKRKYEAEQRLARDTHKVVIDQKRLELDQFKVVTDAQIRAIEAVSAAAAKANEDQRAGNAKKIEDIRTLMEQEKRRDQATIEGIRNQIQAERDRVQDAIKDMQKETASLVKELEKRAKAIEAHFNAIGGGLDTVKAKADAATAALERMRAAIDAAQTAVHGPGGARDDAAATGNQGTTPDGSGPPGSTTTIPASTVMGTGRTIGGDWWSDLWRNIFSGLDPSNPNRWGGFHHDFPHSMTLPEPVELLARSGRSYGVAAATGPEQVSFGGVGPGASAGAGHGHTIVVNLDGRKVGEILADRQGSDIASGYGRRS